MALPCREARSLVGRSDHSQTLQRELFQEDGTGVDPAGQWLGMFPEQQSACVALTV